MIRLWLAGIVMGCAMTAHAQYPTKPIRLIVPYPPGAGTDFTARALGERITEALGQQVVIDSRPGAAATVGHGLVAKAAPDGYTLLLATTGGMVSAPALGFPIVYDPLKDFAYIGLTTFVPYSFVAHGGFPSNNMREFIAYAKTQPGKINFGSSGTGTPNHMGGVFLMKMTGIDMLHVPYKGSAPAQTDVIGGRVQLMFDPLFSVMPFVRGGKLKMIAVTAERRVPGFELLPSVAETYPGFNVTGYLGFVVPTATPRAIVRKIQVDSAAAMKVPDLAARITELGNQAVGSTPEEFDAFVATDMQKWVKVIREAKIPQE